jgi:hypothetical protein
MRHPDCPVLEYISVNSYYSAAYCVKIREKICCHLSKFFIVLTANAPAGCRGKLFLSHVNKGRKQQQTTSEEQMKFNKWTLGLAAVGAVSLASAVRADDAKIIPLQTALANTTISGYVDTAVQYNPGNVGPATGYSQAVPAGTLASQVDAFSLNDLDIAIDHPLDSTPWAAGYHIDLNYGSEAVGLSADSFSSYSGNTDGNFSAIRQAYVALSTPVGNGIQWKLGIQDDIIGYEGNTDSSNPNYTRSIGYSIEPTTLLGLVGTYQINSIISVQGGIAENYTTSPAAGSVAPEEVSSKAFVGAVSLTAPDSWGWIKGATANLGVVLSPYKDGSDNYYAGITIPTPLSALKLGSSFDLRSVANGDGHANPQNDSGWVLGVYGNYQATDKLAFNLRGEYYDLTGAVNPYADTANGKGEELTATIQYNLWANVTSRAEFRWDHSDAGDAFVYDTPAVNSYILALNVIYTF